MFSIQTEFETVLPDILIHLNFKHVYLVISGVKTHPKNFFKGCYPEGRDFKFIDSSHIFSEIFKYCAGIIATDGTPPSWLGFGTSIRDQHIASTSSYQLSIHTAKIER